MEYCVDCGEAYDNCNCPYYCSICGMEMPCMDDCEEKSLEYVRSLRNENNT